MGLRERLAGWAVHRPHVLLVPVPGATAVRLAVEVASAKLGAVLAPSPSDADILVVAGEPGPELGAAVELVWSQLPGPRSRCQVLDPAQAVDALRAAVDELTRPGQEVDAAGRRDEWTAGDAEDMPGGLMMADTGPDRDGLTLDVLRVPLGPVLPDWPAGLYIEVALQGDVVQRAQGWVLPPAGPLTPFWNAPVNQPGRWHAAAHLDSLARLLAVTGWDAVAHRARSLRDHLLGGVPLAQVRPGFDGLRGRLERSRMLRWVTDGLGVLDGSDATARWRHRLTETDRLLSGADPAPDADPVTLLTAAVDLLPGLDVAAARLVVASLDPDTDELGAVTGHGAP